MALSINIDRLKTNILALSEIGKNPEDRGIYRTAFSDADMEGKKWLKQQIETAKLEYRIDGAANVFGKLPGKNANAPAIVVGSHIDTVPCAGALDGTLGVLTALECLTCLQEQQTVTQRDIELVAFSDEEGRFGGMFGSEAFCGSITPETLEYYSDLEQHDAQIVASITPVAMIFVPSKDGQSHSPAEWTAWNDIEAGANLMLNTLLELANK